MKLQHACYEAIHFLGSKMMRENHWSVTCKLETMLA